MVADRRTSALVGVLAMLVIVLSCVWIFNNLINAQKPKIKLISQNLAEKTPELVPKRPIIGAVARDERLRPLLDRTKPLSERLPKDINSILPVVQYVEDYQPLLVAFEDFTENDAVRNEIANLLVRSGYSELTNALIKILNSPDEQTRFRSFAAQHLGTQFNTSDITTNERAIAKMRQLLNDSAVEVRREALLALSRQKDPCAIQSINDTLRSSGPNADKTLDLSIRCAYDLGLRELMPNVRKYARDPDEIIRIAAIATLSLWGDEESRPAFEDASSSEVVRVQRAGKAALQRLDQIK